MALAYLQIFADKVELLEPFDDAERGRLLTAMLTYAMQDVEPVLTGNERYIWPVFRQMIDQSKASLQSKQAGGRARQASSGQQKPAEAQQDSAEASSGQQKPAEAPIIQESGIRNQESGIKNQKGEEKRARFTPPSVEDVEQYAMSQGLHIDARRFVAHYTANGWKTGAAKLVDWRAKVQEWSAEDKASRPRGAPVKSLEQQQYTQRAYVHKEDTVDAMMAEYQRERAGGVVA